MLTAGYVAGFIALGIALASFLLPNVIALLLAGAIGKNRSAAAWSVYGRQLQSSTWPFLFRSDAAATSKIPLDLRVITWLGTAGLVSITIAGIVTPLGIHATIKLSKQTHSVAFGSIADTGAFGQGTPPRDPDAFFNRVCGDGFAIVAGCPFGNTRVNVTRNSTAATVSFDGQYDLRIPLVTTEVFASLYEDHPNTVSGAFDIQYRQYTYETRPGYNNDSAVQVGVFRQLDSLLIDDNVQPIEGLIVDTHSGGIAFRNHTAPVDIELGAEWTEELLFITPESACVDTNLTFEFQIAPIGTYDNYTSSGSGVVNVSLIDRGGFTNINRTNAAVWDYPSQRNVDLYYRAYKAAWVNNVLTMAYLNVTNPRNVPNHVHSFDYVNSSIGRKFYLDSGTAGVEYNRLVLNSLYGGYLPKTGYYSVFNDEYMPNNFTSYVQDPRSRYPNPWNITSDNFTAAVTVCQESGGLDLANISNIAVGCGLMYGAAMPIDGEKSLVFAPGSWWRQSIYSCATAAKAQVRELVLRWNETTATASSPLGSLKVVSVKSKEYKTGSEPIWVAERLDFDLAYMSPLWGLTSRRIAKKYADDPNFDFLQSEHLYVPGSTEFAVIGSLPTPNNLAVSNALSAGISTVFNGDFLDPVLTGQSSIGIYARWQRMTQNATMAAQIPGLIWTDIMANAVMGTRSLMSEPGLPRNTQPNSQSYTRHFEVSSQPQGLKNQDQTVFSIYIYENKIAYDWLFAIPAFITLGLFITIVLASLLLAITGRRMSRHVLSYHVNATSAGRLLAIIASKNNLQPPATTDIDASAVEESPDLASDRLDTDKLLEDDRHALQMPSKEWLRRNRDVSINIDTLCEEPTSVRQWTMLRLRRHTYTHQPSQKKYGPVQETELTEL